MTQYSPDSMESEGSPAKLMAIMIAVALLAAGFFAIAVMIDRKSPDPMYDVNDPTHHTQSQLQMTPDLWKSKHPVDDLQAPPVESVTVQPVKPKSPVNKSQTTPDAQTPAPSTNPS